MSLKLFIVLWVEIEKLEQSISSVKLVTKYIDFLISYLSHETRISLHHCRKKNRV